MIKIGRPNLNDAPSWYAYFFDLAPGEDLIAALQQNKQHLLELISAVPAAAENYKYAADKWTLKQVFIHMAEEERYYMYKAFCCSRQIDIILEVPPSGGAYAKDFNAGRRTLTEVRNELVAVRDATISLFSYMTPEMLDFRGFPHKDVYTARSVGWMVVGHNMHHCNIIRERYLQ
jgi:hypothetical protein